MTVADLIERLREFPDDAIIVISSDEEGNSFSPLDAAERGLYRPETKWSGGFRATEDEGTRDDAVGCVALWPMN